jgi:hypothetical protein
MEPIDKVFYTDHPLPSLGLLVLLGFLFIGFFVMIIIILLTDLFDGYKAIAIGLLIVFNLVIVFSIKLINNTYYTLFQDGLQIKFANKVSTYKWSDFDDVSWKKGLFALKIGWQHVTPCVRLRSALVLRRKIGLFPLYITPTDPEDFLEKIHQVHPSFQ